MEQKYYLGLDIGTDSIGWAVTDEEYNLLKKRGDLWGTYLFDKANTAEDRRKSRTARRRVARTRQRLNLLQELFSEEVAKVDFAFFQRLNNSQYDSEDKVLNSKGVVIGKDSLFHEFGFRDKEYYKKYKTIYHLRNAFLNKNTASEIQDIRLLYLAVHHIIKNRGHFLFEGQNIKSGDKETVLSAFSTYNAIQSDNERPELSLKNIDNVLKVLVETNKGKRDKEKLLKTYFMINGKNKSAIAAIKAVLGMKANMKDLFESEEDLEIKDICFDDVNFDENKYRVVLNDEEFATIIALKSIYDWAVLSQILGDNTYISQAMIEKCKSHKKDFDLLKKYIKENFPDKYKEVFKKNEKTANYASYIGMDGNKRIKQCSKEEFYSYLKKFIKDEKILSKINDGTFLPKLRTNANGVIPYQVHEAELKLILENASINFPFLNNVSDGFTVKEKILKLLTFRVPYYVGPLNDAHAKDGKGFAWVKKFEGKEREKITPWNFEKIVDLNASEDEFIRRMTNKCTYLYGEDVLPKQSILYSEFMFLNELNNLRYDGKLLDKQARDLIIDFARANKKVSIKQIGKLLENNGLIPKGEGTKEKFTGIDGDFKSNMSSYVFLKNVLGDDVDVNMCEQIILWFTIMEDKTRAIERIKRVYKLSDDKLKLLKGFNCSGWGKLSSKFLTDIYHIDGEGEMINIMDAMRTSGKNLMELLSNKYGYLSAINEFNANLKFNEKVTYKTVDDLYCSPSVKRAIWRTVCLVREVEKINGCPPERIFIEMARGAEGKQKNNRTKSRKQQLLDLYKDIKDNERDWIKEIEETPDSKFLSDKLFLYYIQQGRSMYSGKTITIEQAMNTTICDIDHIYPQSKIKDDSIHNNRVLCFKDENALKEDKYPLSGEVRQRMYSMWTFLKEKDFISEEKYKRLTRRNPLTQDELADFIDRQLVETRQSTKAVAEILKTMYPNSDIVYSKAKNVKDFKEQMNRKEMNIVKVRELNDLHHAKDAYLNIVVGNSYYVKFNKNARIFFKNNSVDSYNLKYMFARDIPNAWKVSDKQRIIDTANKNTCKVVRFTRIGTGKLFGKKKSKGTNDNLIPIKQNCPLVNTDKYGGYDSAKTAYFVFVKSLDKKGKEQRSLEAIPIYIDILGKENVIKYLTEKYGKNVTILLDKIKLDSLLKLNGAYVWLKGKTGVQIELCNANQLLLPFESVLYLKKIIKFIEKKKKLNAEIAIDENYDGIFMDKNMELYQLFIDKLSNKPYNKLSIVLQAKVLSEYMENFKNLPIEKQCSALYEILHFFQCNSVASNLKIIDAGASSEAGVIVHSKNIKEDEEAILITQSPTGYYSKTIDLNTL